MANESKRSVKITGTGSASGGDFHHVRIMGEGRVHGDIACEDFKCMGNCMVGGTLQTRRYRLQGEAVIGGDMQAGVLTGHGQIQVKGNIRGQSIKLTGQLTAGGACEADKLKVNGAIDIRGLVNAEQLDISLFGPCRAKEIGGGRITVRRSKWIAVKQMLSPHGNAELQADCIEGDDIYLEHTKADNVRGNHVKIGPGCHIALVEYRDTLQTSKSATVLQERKM